VDFYRGAGKIGSLEILALGDSPVHRIHPGLKLVATLVYIGTVVSFPPGDLSGPGIFILYPVALMPLSGTPWKPLAARLLVSLPFVLAGAFSNLLMLKETVFYIGSFPVTAGMLSFASILYRTFLAVLAVLILIATTPFPDLVRQLGRMGMPRVFCLQTTMTWRYLNVLIAEAGAMYTAYLLRSGGKKGIGMKHMGSFLGLLLLRSFDRAERVYRAMKSRGFDGNFYYTGAGGTGGVSGANGTSGANGGGARSILPVEWLCTFAFCGVVVFFRFFNAGDFLGGIIMKIAGG
jgi:cobalt/nickel transport system permease protein